MQTWSNSDARPTAFPSPGPSSYKTYRSGSSPPTRSSSFPLSSSRLSLTSFTPSSSRRRLILGVVVVIVVLICLHYYFSSSFSSSSSSSSSSLSSRLASILPPKVHYSLWALSHSISSHVHSAAAAVRSHVPALGHIHAPSFLSSFHLPSFLHRPLNEGFSNGVDDKDFILTDGSGGITTYNVGALGADVDAKVRAVSQRLDALQSYLDPLNLQKAVYNIEWLMQFQLDDVRNKVLYCEDQVNNKVVRYDATYLIQSMMDKRDPHALDCCSNGQRARQDNAHRRFKFVKTKYGPDDYFNGNQE